MKLRGKHTLYATVKCDVRELASILLYFQSKGINPSSMSDFLSKIIASTWNGIQLEPQGTSFEVTDVSHAVKILSVVESEAHKNRTQPIKPLFQSEPNPGKVSKSAEDALEILKNM